MEGPHYLMHVPILPASVSVYHTYAWWPSAHEGRKSTSDPLVLEL